MAKRVLFQPRVRNNYQTPYYSGAYEIELQTSENSILEFHKIRCPYYDPRNHNNGALSGDVVSSELKQFSNGAKNNIDGILDSVMEAIKTGISNGMYLYSRILSVAGANPENLRILLGDEPEKLVPPST